MDHAALISRGAVAEIHHTGKITGNPVLQVIELKSITPANPAATTSSPRYRFGLSDGVHTLHAITASQLTVLITEQKLKALTLIRLKEFICNNLNNKRILIILNLEVIAHLPKKIGNPIHVYVALDNQPQGVNQQANPNQLKTNAPQPFHNNRGIQNNAQIGYGQQQSAPVSNGFGAQNNFGNTSSNNYSPVGFGGNAKSWQPGNAYSNTGVVTKINSTPANFFRPIQSINPYQNGWTIRGRCTYKSDLRKFQNSRGEGQVISFELTDESGSIRVTGFTQRAPEISENVNINRIYKVSRGQLKQANERFNHSTSNFEMTLDQNSVLEPEEDDGSFMKIKYNFTKIADLDSIDVKGNCDVVGVVTSIGPLDEIIIRSTGDPCNKRSITLADESNAAVELTLWRKQAESFLTENDLARHPVVLLRNASRGDYGGVCLNVSRMTTIEKDPINIPEANKLRAWYDGGGLASANLQSVTSTGRGGGKITGQRKSIAQAKTEDVNPVFADGDGSSGATANFVTRTVISFINTKNDLYYPADPESKKKLISQGSGLWSSESSGKQLSDLEVQWRYVMSLKMMDSSDCEWASGFDEVGVLIFGRGANELRELKEKDLAMYESLLEDVTFRPMLMKVQVKERMWRDARQIRYTVSRAEFVDFATESHQLLKEIAAYGGM